MKLADSLKIGAIGAVAVIGGLGAFTALATRRAERRFSRQGRMMRVDGANLHYVDMGLGPPIVLVHGLGGQLGNFTYALADRLVSDFRVIVVDRPGSGYSQFEGTGGRGIHAQAAIIGRLIRALSLDRPLMVGHSLGGAISLTLATQTRDLLGGIALICPLTQPMATPPAIFRPLTITSPFRRALVARTLATPLATIKRARTLETIFAPEAVPADFNDRGGGALGARPSAFQAASTEVTSVVADLEEIVPDYGGITLPVGILFGRDDRLLSPTLHGERTAAMIPGAELELIDGGHMIPMTQPDATANWLRRQASRIAERQS